MELNLSPAMSIQEYIAALDATYQQGNATEHSYRGYLQQLLETQLPKQYVTNEPSRIACGAPDYIITDGKSGLPLAFIEAKDIGEPDLRGLKGNRELKSKHMQ